jgi:ubiquinone/menaquinone biosynthesis C-methylase UbiE
MANIAEIYAELPKPLRRPLWQFWHRTLIKYDGEMQANFMNYGYEKLNGDPRLQLHATDETDRYCIQLYDHVVNRASLQGKHVLEVGAGRGGGAHYITRYYKPKSYTALDISETSINYCNSHYDLEELSFVRGVAEDLPFEDESFDFLVNVESSRCYKSLDDFYSEVHRVLRPGGQFLYADMNYPKDLDKVTRKLGEAGFKTLHVTDISPNVVAALEKDTERREQLIDQKVPRILRKSFKTFAGTVGTSRYKNFAEGIFQYWSYVLEKSV